MEALPVLERVVARYRRDVNVLSAGASPAAVQALENHLGRRLPGDLRRFLALHNGASLFRGSLRLRSTSEMSAASVSTPQVILFADGPGDERWAFAAAEPLVAVEGEPGRAGGLLPTESDGFVFGLWDGARLEPVYRGFLTWLDAEIARIETRVVRSEDLAALRREIAPHDPVLALRDGAAALAAGRPDEAEELLALATRRDPTSGRAWQLLGDALAIRDRAAARHAWHTALRCTRFPVPWPGAPVVGEELLAALAPDRRRDPIDDPSEDEEWERELGRFLTEQVADVTDAESAAVVTSAALHLARSLVRRGRRIAAREALTDLLSRAVQFRLRTPPWPVVIELVQLETGLGHHDAAEQLIRQIRRHGPPELLGPALLLLAEIAVQRQEPWAEELVDDAITAGLDESGRLHAAIIRVERSIRHDRPDEVRGLAEGIGRAAKRVGSAKLSAMAALVLGDLARATDAEAADAAYRTGLEELGDRDAETRLRLTLRRAEVSWASGRREPALKLATAAVEGFRALQLPVREAWALVRLARFVEAAGQGGRAQALRQAARERFVEADLAAGVAAVDSLAGDPGASLAWHLERATAQARSRHDAQRTRPPWDRSDAERPERRLGAHRLAIAACENGVVTSIARELDACARAASVGRGRPTDPPVLRYVAAVDLLSGHRSYEAARVLLDHLFTRGIDGVMHRALQGAIARSPNAAVVDGLLTAVERPHERPAPAVAAAAELLGLRREPAAIRALVKLVDLDPAKANGSPAARRSAIVALGRIGDRSVVETVVPSLFDPRLAEPAALALLMLGDRRGVDFHGRALVDQRADLTGSPGEIVGRYGGPDHLLLLMRAAEGEGERAIGALQGLGLLGDPRGATTLLKALHARDRRTVEVACGALTILTGRTDDPDEPGVRARWAEWWERSQSGFTPGVRYRHGAAFDLARLIDQMEDRDPYVRRTAYDELVITSGASLPFDADGPWRVQLAHLAGWRRWWSENRHLLPAGRWALDGKVVA
ncbi:MAG: SMI1/KNR4 family protein [Myxococcota bacterium]